MVNMNKFKDPAIYALYVDDGVYYYVGSTTGNSKNRLWEHIYRGRAGHDSPVYHWMREVGLENVRVIDLEKVSDISNIKSIEAVWIKGLIAEGQPLLNQISRDGVVNSMSDESKRKIGSRAKGRPTWIKGKTGYAAGWTEARRKKQAETIRKRQLGQ